MLKDWDMKVDNGQIMTIFACQQRESILCRYVGDCHDQICILDVYSFISLIINRFCFRFCFLVTLAYKSTRWFAVGESRMLWKYNQSRRES